MENAQKMPEKTMEASIKYTAEEKTFRQFNDDGKIIEVTNF